MLLSGVWLVLVYTLTAALLCVVAVGSVEGAGSDWGADCAQPAEANASASPAATAANFVVVLVAKLLVITTPPDKPRLSMALRSFL